MGNVLPNLKRGMPFQNLRPCSPTKVKNLSRWSSWNHFLWQQFSCAHCTEAEESETLNHSSWLQPSCLTPAAPKQLHCPCPTAGMLRVCSTFAHTFCSVCTSWDGAAFKSAKSHSSPAAARGHTAREAELVTLLFPPF